MDSKEGIEEVAPIDAQAAGLLDPSLLRSGRDDPTMADLPREWAGGPVGSQTSPDENNSAGLQGRDCTLSLMKEQFW